MGEKSMNNNAGKKKYVPIRVKILSIILPVIVFAIGILIFVSYYMSSSIIEQKSYSMLESSVKNQTSQIENWLDNNLATFNTIKQSLGSASYSQEDMKKVLNQYYNFNNNFSEGLYISDLDGNVITAEDSKMQFGDVKASQWFKEGLTHIKMRYGEPHENYERNNVISATGLIVQDGQPVGVIGGDVTLNRISIIVNSLIDMEDAQAFLVDKTNSMVLASSDSLKPYSILDNNNTDKLYSLISQKIDSGDYDAVEIQNNIVQIREINNTNWVLV